MRKLVLYITMLLLPCLSLGQTLNEIEEPQYKISFDLLEFNSEQNRLASKVLIQLSNGWKLLAKSNFSKESHARMEVTRGRNLKDVSIVWPEPVQIENDNLHYVDFVAIPIELDVVEADKQVGFDLVIDLSACGSSCIQRSHIMHIEVDDVRKYSNKPTALFSMELIRAMIFAFIGGVILNFMPCVLPVLSMKILSVLNSTRLSNKQIKRQFFATIIGICTSFFGLAAFTHFLKVTGEYAGLGLNFQQPEFIIFLVFGLVSFASNLNDRFFINTPKIVHRFANWHQDETKLLGSFFSGVFATLLATPCTAPFVGSAISFAMTYGGWEIYMIFATIGLGMSLPYIVLILFPKQIRMIPRPGKWMNILKKSLVIMVYLTVIWLLYVLFSLLDQKSVIIIFLLCLLLQFVLENKQSILKYSFVKIALIVLIVAAGFIMPKEIFEQDVSNAIEVKDTWQPYSQEKLEQHISEGKTVLVDVGAEWCVTCKLNKFVVLDNQFMLSYYQKHGVVTMRANYTAKNAEINALLKSYNQTGIPFDIVFSKKYPHGIVLPTILKTSDVIKAINKANP